jgi:hypothetical protein
MAGMMLWCGQMEHVACYGIILWLVLGLGDMLPPWISKPVSKPASHEELATLRWQRLMPPACSTNLMMTADQVCSQRSPPHGSCC